MTIEKNGNGSVKFSSLFTPDDIICLSEPVSRDDAIMQLLQLLALQHGIGNVNKVFDDVIEREKAGSTIIAPYIGMPHARIDSVEQVTVAVATCAEGIDFMVEDEDPVKVIILILTPKVAPAAYLQAVSSLSKICIDPEFPKLACDVDSPKELWRLFDRGGHVLPDFVCAGDIMETNFPRLKEDDNLQQAIDMFVRYQVVDLPVVDNSNELVGVVTSLELMKVCLPDYILWMEDLSPIMNFEPFAEILRNEEKTWLADIMSMDYAAVSVDMPAVQVAKEITRRNARVVYVVKDTTLVGRVTLQDFINKVLRA